MNNLKIKKARKKFAKDIYNSERKAFDIHELQRVTELDNKDDNFYEDFVVPPLNEDGNEARGRLEVQVKLGKLYIIYTPGGKGSYEVNVFIRNSNHDDLYIKFMKFENERYWGVEFEELIPISMHSFYPGYTDVGFDSNNNNIVNSRKNANEIKNLLICLAMGEDVPQDVLKPTSFRFLKDFYELEEYQEDKLESVEQNLAIAKKEENQIVKNNQDRDLKFFFKNPTVPPKTLFEISAKLGMLYCNKDIEEELAEDDVKKIFDEFKNSDKHNNAQLTAASIGELFKVLIDEGRFTLVMFCNNVTTEIDRICKILNIPKVNEEKKGQEIKKIEIKQNNHKNKAEGDIFHLRNVIQYESEKPKNIILEKNQRLQDIFDKKILELFSLANVNPFNYQKYLEVFKIMIEYIIIRLNPNRLSDTNYNIQFKIERNIFIVTFVDAHFNQQLFMREFNKLNIDVGAEGSKTVRLNNISFEKLAYAFVNNKDYMQDALWFKPLFKLVLIKLFKSFFPNEDVKSQNISSNFFTNENEINIFDIKKEQFNNRNFLKSVDNSFDYVSGKLKNKNDKQSVMLYEKFYYFSNGKQPPSPFSLSKISSDEEKSNVKGPFEDIREVEKFIKN